MCNRLEDLLLSAFSHVLRHNHHRRLLYDGLARELLRREFLHSLLSVQLVNQDNVHDESYPGDVTQALETEKI